MPIRFVFLIQVVVLIDKKNSNNSRRRPWNTE